VTAEVESGPRGNHLSLGQIDVNCL